MVAVDIRGRWWLPWRCLRKGRRVRRPYTDLSNLPGLRCRVGARCVSLQGVVSIIVTGRQLFRWRCLQPGRRVRRPYTDLSNLPGLRCRVGARCVSLQGVGDGSTIVPLEVSGRRVRRPYTDLSNPRCLGCPRRRPFRSSAGRHRHNRRKSAVWCGGSGWSRSTFGVDGGSRGGVYAKGDACVAPTQIYRTHGAWTLPIGTRFVPLRGVIVIIGANLRFGVGGVGYSRSTFGVDGGSPGGIYQPGDALRRPYTDLSNLPGLRCRVGARCVSLQGVVSIIVTGRQLFRWRCLQPGRRVRRPYTDLSNPRCLGCPRRRPFRSSASAAIVRKGTVWFKPCVAPNMPPTGPVGRAGAFHGGRFVPLRDPLGDHLWKPAPSAVRSAIICG